VSVYGTDALVYAEAFLGWLFKESASAEASTSPRLREGPPLSIGGSSPNQRPFSLNVGGAGILTCWPSSTPFGLDLGSG
jgi:hypothetical protein